MSARKVAAVSVPACQVCGSAHSREYHRGERGTLFECDACGFVFLHPIPDASTQAARYEREHIGAGYLAKVPAKMRRARARVRLMQSYCAGGRFLDVGCNGGFMVEAARAAGFAASGIDPDGVAVAWARAHYPHNTFAAATLEQFIATAGEPFDAVYCAEVIEHVPDCNQFALALARALKPGGTLYLTTPNIRHWRRGPLARWDGYKPPEHCLYFSPGPLRALLARHGLRVVRERWAWKPGIQVLAARISPS